MPLSDTLPADEPDEEQQTACVALIWGDDDPYISQEEFAFIAQQLDPTQIKIAGGKHFIEQAQFPELLQYVKQTYL